MHHTHNIHYNEINAYTELNVSTHHTYATGTQLYIQHIHTRTYTDISGIVKQYYLDTVHVHYYNHM